VIDAVNLALGERADKSLIRTGAEKASVQALFDIGENPAARAFLEANRLECDDGLVAVSRELSLSGRSVARVSGQIVPLAMLRAFTSLIVDVHGQHEHQSLLNDETHLACLDGFAHDALARCSAKPRKPTRPTRTRAGSFKALPEARRSLPRRWTCSPSRSTKSARRA
jgi:DNA repair protein RecN (Recombination protein N)